MSAAEESFDLPEEFRLQDAENGDRVEAVDADATYVVLVDQYNGERQLVREEIVEWDEWWQHPTVKMFGAAAGLLLLVFAPFIIGSKSMGVVFPYWESNGVDDIWQITYLVGWFAGVAGLALAGWLYENSPVEWLIYRQNRYQQVRPLLEEVDDE